MDLFYDGGCPVCRRQVERLKRFDRAGAIRHHDITSPDFCAQTWGVAEQDDLMREIHARLDDGTWVSGVEAIRRVLDAIGLSPLAGMSRLRGLAHLFDRAYRWYAANRTRDAWDTACEACSS